MSDSDQAGEPFDDEVVGDNDEYPPEQPLGVEDQGAVGGVRDSLEERDERLSPERRPAAVRPDPSTGALADDDEFTGDETTRDVATEKAPPSAEEDAIHIERP